MGRREIMFTKELQDLESKNIGLQERMNLLNKMKIKILCGDISEDERNLLNRVDIIKRQVEGNIDSGGMYCY